MIHLGEYDPKPEGICPAGVRKGGRGLEAPVAGRRASQIMTRAHRRFIF
jgi:hypothetical protein